MTETATDEPARRQVRAPRGRRWWLPWAAWVVAAIASVAWCSSRTIPIGRMVLPPAQAAALASTLAVAFTLVALWLWLGLRLLARRLGMGLGLVLRPHPLDRRRPRQVLGGLLGVCLLLYGYARYVEPRWVVVRSVPLGPVPIAGVTSEPVRLVVLSDLHVEGPEEPWASLPTTVNELEPDLILLLGDLLNDGAALPALQRTLRAMHASTAKLAVRGNWDVWYWHDLPLLRQTGFRWLDREVATVDVRGQSVHLLGWDYRDGDRGLDADALLAPLPATDWRLFAHHTPDLAPAVPSADLALAGHTHGGQVALPLYGAFVTLSRYGKRFERGLGQVGPTRIYVNPGIGVEPAVPLRFLVRPEVTLLLLGPK